MGGGCGVFVCVCMCLCVCARAMSGKSTQACLLMALVKQPIEVVTVPGTVELLEPGFLHGLALAWALLFGSQPSPGRRAGVVSTGKALRLGGGHGTVPAGHLQR